MERLQAVLAVAVASAVLAYSGVSGVTAGSASGVNVSSLLLSRVAKRAYRFVSVGDQKHFWAWEVGEKGVYVVDTAGTILNSGKPLLPDSRPFAVTPAGDHIHALVSALPGSREQDPKKGGLLVVGRSPEESKDRSLLPEGDSAESVFITDKGAWVRSPLSGLYFLDQSLTPRRVNDSLSSKIVSTKNGILVSGREWVHQQNSIVSHGLDVSLLKPSGALTKITSENLLPKAAGDADLVATIVDLPQESEVWFFPRLHHGIHILNVDDAVKSRDGNYKAIDLFANSDMYVRFTADGGAWAFPINSDRSFSDRDDLEKGAYLLERERLEKGLSPDPIPSLSDVVVQEIVPLSATTALVQGVFGGKTRVAFVSRSGETAVLDDSFLLRHGSPVPSAPQVFHEEDGPDYFILTETGELLRFDVDKRKLEVLSRSYASIFEQGKTGIWMVVPDLSSPSRGVSFYDFSKKRITKGPFFQQAPLMPNFSFEEGGDRGLVASEPFGTFLFECDRKSLPIEVTLGKTRFSLEAPQTLPDVISFDPNGPEIDATLELGQSFAKRLTPGSQVSIEISWGVNKQHRVFETPDLSNSASAHRFHVAEEVGGRVPLNSPIKFAVSFRDSLGSKVAYEWRDVKFQPSTSLIDEKWFRSVLVYVALIALVVAGTSARGVFQRWGPLGFYLVGSAVGLAGGARDVLNERLLFALLSVTFVGAGIGGLIAPAIFRELEKLEPFKTVAPWTASFSRMRRSLFANYIRRLSDDLDLARKQANNEAYVQLAIGEIDARQIRLGNADTSALRLLNCLTAAMPDERGHVLISSPGGRGKSALIRETVRRALEHFRSDPSRPLPIICNGEGDDLFARIKTSLATDGFSDDLTRSLMQSGHFFLVIDGLSEAAISPQSVQTHLTQYGVQCPLLLASRPSDKFRRIIEATSAWVIVEPVLLSDETLPSFVEKYGARIEEFNDELKQACRSVQGEYLPILVRLAILGLAERPKSVSDVYRNAVRQLLKCNDAMMDQAVELCVETYWRDGQRVLAYATANEGRKATLKMLLDSGLLIPADGKHGTDEPRTVRFFHDSIQSYLTAVGLGRVQDRMEVLTLAAASERFAGGRSDLLTGAGSELFQMCLHVFEPQSGVRIEMREALLSYADSFAGSFSRDWVAKAVGDQSLTSDIGASVAGGSALKVLLSNERVASDIRLTGRLFASVIHLLWDQIKDNYEDRQTANQSYSAAQKSESVPA